MWVSVDILDINSKYNCSRLFLLFSEVIISNSSIMKKSLEKMRVRIDQNLNRSEKTIALPLELEKLGM